MQETLLKEELNKLTREHRLTIEFDSLLLELTNALQADNQYIAERVYLEKAVLVGDCDDNDRDVCVGHDNDNCLLICILLILTMVDLYLSIYLSIYLPIYLCRCRLMDRRKPFNRTSSCWSSRTSRSSSMRSLWMH